MSKKKLNHIIALLSVVTYDLAEQGKILKDIQMKTTELTTIENLNAQLSKVKDEYAAFVAEAAEKEAVNVSTIEALTEQNELLRAQIEEQADPEVVQATLNKTAELINVMDANRIDIPVTSIPDPEPAQE